MGHMFLIKVAGETATRTDTHRNTDRSNAYCHCSIGADHGNIAEETAEFIVSALLRLYDVELSTSHRGVQISRTPTSPRGWVTGVLRVLRSYGFKPNTEPDRNQRTVVLVALEAFNRK